MSGKAILIALSFAVIGSGASHAQLSKMRGCIDKIRECTERIDELARRDPIDEPQVFRLAREIREAAQAGGDAINAFGRPLAGAAASSESRERLREPDRLATALAYELGTQGKMYERCMKIAELINTDPQRRPDHFEAQVQELTNGLLIQGRARVNDLDTLTTKANETMRWLEDSLQAARAMANDAIRPGEAIEAGRRRVTARIQEQFAEFHRFNENMINCQNAAAEAARRYGEVTSTHDAARHAPPGPDYAPNAIAAYRNWLAAERDQREAMLRVYEAVAVVERATAEIKTRLAELANVLKELDRFQANANPETIGQRLTDFDQWSKLFKADLNR